MYYRRIIVPCQYGFLKALSSHGIYLCSLIIHRTVWDFISGYSPLLFVAQLEQLANHPGQCRGKVCYVYHTSSIHCPSNTTLFGSPLHSRKDDSQSSSDPDIFNPQRFPSNKTFHCASWRRIVILNLIGMHTCFSPCFLTLNREVALLRQGMPSISTRHFLFSRLN